MSQPRFLTDEDFRGVILRALRRMASRLEISSIVEAGLSGATDDEVLEFAWAHRFLVVSHDVHTMKPAAERRIATLDGIHGLFLVPQSRVNRLVVESLILIGSASEFEEWRNQIVYLPF